MNTTSEPTDSYVPSNNKPTSSPFEFIVGDPELPPVVSTSLKKSTGTSPSAALTYLPNFFAFAASTNLAGALNGSLVVTLATISEIFVKGLYMSASGFGRYPRTVPYVMRSVPLASD